jgi:hypothetical protein
LGHRPAGRCGRRRRARSSRHRRPPTWLRRHEVDRVTHRHGHIRPEPKSRRQDDRNDQNAVEQHGQADGQPDFSRAWPGGQQPMGRHGGHPLSSRPDPPVRSPSRPDRSPLS